MALIVKFITVKLFNWSYAILLFVVNMVKLRTIVIMTSFKEFLSVHFIIFQLNIWNWNKIEIFAWPNIDTLVVNEQMVSQLLTL